MITGIASHACYLDGNLSSSSVIFICHLHAHAPCLDFSSQDAVGSAKMMGATLCCMVGVRDKPPLSVL